MWLLLLLPLISAKIVIYSGGFDPTCYSYSSSVEEMRAFGPEAIANFLEDMGFEVEVTDRIPNDAKALVIPACTYIDEQVLEKILKVVERNGGVLIDAWERSPLLRELKVVRLNHVEDIERRSFKHPYVEIKNGVLVNSILEGGPIRRHSKLYYVGPAIEGAGYNVGVVTENGEAVLLWKEGRGRIVVTGCLFCMGPYLLANTIDWIEDGKIDFPEVTVERDAIPSVVKKGSQFMDRIIVEVEDTDANVSGEYLYNIGEPFCKTSFEGMDLPEREIIRGRQRIELRYRLKAEEVGSCILPPSIIYVESEEGKREIIADPVEISVTGVFFESEEIPSWLYLAVPVSIAAAVFLYKRLRIKVERDRILRALHELDKKFKKREIDKESYTKIRAEYMKRLIELEALGGGQPKLGRQK